jgi:hypothetical protein
LQQKSYYIGMQKIAFLIREESVSHGFREDCLALKLPHIIPETGMP